MTNENDRVIQLISSAVSHSWLLNPSDQVQKRARQLLLELASECAKLNDEKTKVQNRAIVSMHLVRFYGITFNAAEELSDAVREALIKKSLEGEHARA